jgi:hypothetical protein
MFVVGEDAHFPAFGATVVGVARNVLGTLAQWKNLYSYPATDSLNLAAALAPTGNSCVVESPLVMRDSSGTGPWRIFVANANYNDYGTNSTFFTTNNPDSSVANPAIGNWGPPHNLYTYLNDNGALVGWQASEHVQVGEMHLFAAFENGGIAITRTHWEPDKNTFVIGNPLAGVHRPKGDSSARFYLAGYRPGASTVSFVLDATGRTNPRLVIYDLQGRKVRMLATGLARVGSQRWVWDRRGEDGSPTPSGVYFARLTGAGSPRVVRAVVLR